MVPKTVSKPAAKGRKRLGAVVGAPRLGNARTELSRIRPYTRRQPNTAFAQQLLLDSGTV